MKKLAFVGTCQVRGMASAAAQWLPDFAVTAYPLGGEAHDEVADAIRDADFVVTQTPEGSGSPLAVSALNATGASAIFMPPAVFTGFHPDMFYLVINGESVLGGISQYHSQIAFASYVLGLTPDRACQLYNAHVFAELGHFQAYAHEVEMMTATFARHGYDLRPLLERMQERKIVFMHTINHPTIFLLDRLTVLALRRLNLVGMRVPPLRGLHDELAEGVIGPIYRPIAKRIGVRAQDHHLQPTEWVPADGSRDMSKRAFVDAVYARYAKYDRAELRATTAAPIIDRLEAILA